MRCIVFLLVTLLPSKPADEFLVSGLKPSPGCSASDYEYVLGEAKQELRRLAERRRSSACSGVLPVDSFLTFTDASLPFSYPDLPIFGCRPLESQGWRAAERPVQSIDCAPAPARSALGTGRPTRSTSWF